MSESRDDSTYGPMDALEKFNALVGATPAEQPPAKLQVLYLPEEKVGDATRYPFALIISELADDLSDAENERWREFRQNVGAVAGLVTTLKIEVV